MGSGGVDRWSLAQARAVVVAAQRLGASPNKNDAFATAGWLRTLGGADVLHQSTLLGVNGCGVLGVVVDSDGSTAAAAVVRTLPSLHLGCRR